MTVRRCFRIFALLSLVCLCLSGNISHVYADGNYTVVIDDQEDLLSEREEQMLKIKMEEVAKYGNVAFVTVSQYGDTSSYAKQLYRSLFGKSSGFLFLIDMGRRNIWIFSDGAIYRVIDRAYANTITDNIYRYASRGEYYDCAYHAYDQALTLLKGGRIAQPMKYISNFLISCVVALLGNFLFLSMNRTEAFESRADVKPLLTEGPVSFSVLSKKRTKKKVTRHYESSGGGGHSGGGGGFSGGGGGGGGSSGGGGGHSF